MTTTAELLRQYNEAADQLDRPAVKKFADRATAERRTAAILADLAAKDEAVTVKPEAPKKTPTVIEKVTEPIRKDHAPRTVTIARGSRINRHYNDDGSITLYAQGVKLWRSASDEDIEEGVVSEDYDQDAEVEKFLNRWFGKNKPWVFGTTTRGNNWKRRTQAATDDKSAGA